MPPDIIMGTVKATADIMLASAGMLFGSAASTASSTIQDGARPHTGTTPPVLEPEADKVPAVPSDIFFGTVKKSADIMFEE